MTPVDAVFATADPLIVPVKADERTATKAAPKECRDAAASEDLDGLLGAFSFGSGGARAKRLASKMRRKIKKRATPKKVKKKVKRGVVEHASTRRGAL